MNSVGFYIHKIMSSEHRDSFTSSFSNWMTFFLPKITLDITSSIMLNRSGESRHLCFVPNLKGKNFQSFTTEYDVSCGFCVDAHYQIEEVPFCFFAECFYRQPPFYFLYLWVWLLCAVLCSAVLSHSVVSDLLGTPWTVARQALLLSMGFSRQEYWSGLPCPPPGDLPNPGIEPSSATLQSDFLLS